MVKYKLIMSESNEKEPPKITVRAVKSDLSGNQYGPWKVLGYLHHYGNTPIWTSECIYCNTQWSASIPKIKKKRECDCEESMKFTSGVYIYNDIYQWYMKKAIEEDSLFNLSYIDLYKIYLRQNGVDKNGDKLIFDFHYNYNFYPPTCNYIWPDLERKSKTSSYSLSNCFFMASEEQRFPRKFSTNNKKIRAACPEAY